MGMAIKAPYPPGYLLLEQLGSGRQLSLGDSVDVISSNMFNMDCPKTQLPGNYDHPAMVAQLPNCRVISAWIGAWRGAKVALSGKSLISLYTVAGLGATP